MLMVFVKDTQKRNAGAGLKQLKVVHIAANSFAVVRFVKNTSLYVQIMAGKSQNVNAINAGTN